MHRIPMTFEITDKSFTVFFDNVAVTSGPSDRWKRQRAARCVRRHEPRAGDHLVDLQRHRAVRDGQSGRPTHPNAGSGRCRSARYQGVAHPLAEAKIALEAARLMTRHAAADLRLRGADAGEPSNMAKLMSADAATRCVDQAIEVHGGSGFTREVALANMYEFVQALQDRADHPRDDPQSHRAAQSPTSQVILSATPRHRIQLSPKCLAGSWMR